MKKGQQGFKKGDPDCGAPEGKPSNYTKNKIWRDVIRRAVLTGDGKRLRSLADALVAKAEQGDIQALKEVGDRLDGKSVQEIEANGDTELKVTIVKFGDLPD